eukprot:gene7490-8321_t
MADDDSSLSDAELRAQLKAHGVNPGPITASTRPVLLKKLGILKRGESANQPAKQTKKSRRSVASSTPTRHKTKLSGFSSGEEEFPTQSVNSVDSPASRRKSAIPKVVYINKIKDEGASSQQQTEDREEEKEPSRPTPNRRRSFPRTAVRQTRSFDSISTNSRLEQDGSTSTNANDSPIHQIRSTFRKNSFEFEEEDAMDGDEVQKTIAIQKKSPLKTSSSSDTAISYQKKRSSPKKSDDSTPDKNPEDNEQDEEELEVAFAHPTGFVNTLKGPLFAVLVSILMTCLVGSYISLFSSGLTELPEDLKVTKALAKGDQEKAFDLLQCLHGHLARNAGLKECDFPNADETMTGEKVAGFAADSCFSGFKDKLQNYEKLAVNAVNMAMGDKFTDFFSIVDERVKKGVPVDARTLRSITISSKLVDKPLTCRLKQALHRLSRYIFVLVLVLGIALPSYYFLKKRWMRDDEDTRLMFVFVERIIETLRRHNDACKHDKELPAFLPIPHVRDMLIPPRERNAKLRAWKKAVDFLSSTDSRIRVETQRIAGEDFEVWRWIGVSTSDPKIKGAKNHLGSEDETGKYWQGPAFDKLEKVVRMPIITPTPCLKIRYLHGGPAEKEDGWSRRVRDALLEKCINDGANILHIYVDIKSPEGCVYVKCDSLDSAGLAFRSIYGNWFDGRLVIVKFVTLARYHHRFPEARDAVQPLKSSGEFPSSLSWASSSPEQIQKK